MLPFLRIDADGRAATDSKIEFNELGFGIAVDANGVAAVAGTTTSTNFPTLNAFQNAFAAGTCSDAGNTFPCGDAFVTRLVAAGNALVRAIGPLAKSTRRPGADAELGGFGGVFDPKAMAVLKKSFIDMQILEKEPKEAELIDTRFLPVKR